MRAVAESGAQPIRLDRALELLRAPVSRRYVCVTFDDGYRDNLLEAAPVLAEFGIPATIYLPSRIIDGEVSFHWYADPPPALSWDEVGELVGGGLIDVQSHTLTHPLLPQVDAERSREEITASKAEIERHVPYALTSFCYPAGLYGAREVEFVRDAGYAAAVTTNPGRQRRRWRPARAPAHADLRRRRSAGVRRQARRPARRRDDPAPRPACAPLACCLRIPLLA